MGVRMKLLLCVKCSDVFVLRENKKRACSCGLSDGEYVDDLNAEVTGPCIVIGFSNHSLLRTIRTQMSNGDQDDGNGRRFEAFIIPESAPSVKRLDNCDPFKDLRK